MAQSQAPFHIPDRLARAWGLPPTDAVVAVRAAVPEMVADIRSEAGDQTPAIVSSLGALIASADGKVDAFEREVMQQALSDLGLKDNDTVFDAALEDLERTGPDAAITRLGSELAQLGIAAPACRLGIAIAYVDSGIHANERSVVEAIAAAAGLDGAQVLQLMEEVHASIVQPDRSRASGHGREGLSEP